MSNTLTHISLFSGIGGFDLAAHWAGFQNIAHCEWNPFGQQVLNHYFPESHSYADITKTDFTQYRDQITVLTGGFPCQPFSFAGKRGGSEDDRYLWPEMLRAIREIRPTWVIGENVFGITTMVQPGTPTTVGSQASIFNEGSPIYEEQREFVIETICSDLEREGYSVQPIVVPACAVGAPHRRDRIWFIANRANTGIENVQQRGKVGVCEVGHAANTDGIGLEETRTEQQTARSTRSSALRSSTNTDGIGLDGRIYKDGSQTAISQYSEGSCTRESSRRESGANWKIFPTQPPVYTRNDGIPRELAGRSFPPNKWREESVKACGNAIVPQVAYQFFEMIKQIQK